MYEISVERDFRAAHAITVNGQRETPHDHDWHVRIVVAGDALDADGLLYDFHDLERHVDAAIDPLRGADLNATPPFHRGNPTAERVARHLAESIGAALPDALRVDRVAVTEAPGCPATYVVRRM